MISKHVFRLLPEERSNLTRDKRIEPFREAWLQGSRDASGATIVVEKILRLVVLSHKMDP